MARQWRVTGHSSSASYIPETRLTGQLAQLGPPLLQQLRRQLERGDVRFWEVPVVRFAWEHKHVSWRVGGGLSAQNADTNSSGKKVTTIRFDGIDSSTSYNRVQGEEAATWVGRNTHPRTRQVATFPTTNQREKTNEKTNRDNGDNQKTSINSARRSFGFVSIHKTITITDYTTRLLMLENTCFNKPTTTDDHSNNSEQHHPPTLLNGA